MSDSNGESNNGGMSSLIKSWNRVFISLLASYGVKCIPVYYVHWSLVHYSCLVIGDNGTIHFFLVDVFRFQPFL